VLVPGESERRRVHEIIFRELCRGKIRDESRRTYLSIVADLAAAGAEAVILGCTEIGLLIGQSDTPVPLYDTTAIHAAAAVSWAMAPR
jgi:aspartate racemase